jgi:hypothetical protein
MEMRKGLALVLLVSLQGCATSYRPPAQQPPEEWTGVAGWEVLASTIKVHEGARRPGDTLMEYEVRPRRTAVVLETVQTKTAYGKDFIIPEGTKLFAENFTLVTRGGWWGEKEIKQSVDPIEWCGVLPHGTDGKQKGADTACLFWEGPTQARYMQQYKDGGFAFSPRMHDTSGMPGPVPKIKVQPVDFGVQILSKVRIVKMSPRRIELEFLRTDGASEQRLELRTLNWKEGRKASYGNIAAQFDLTASPDYTSVDLVESTSSLAARTSRQPVVFVCVDDKGALAEEPKISTSSGNARLDEAAIQLAKAGRYAAGHQGGAGCFNFKVKFELKDE